MLHYSRAHKFQISFEMGTIYKIIFKATSYETFEIQTRPNIKYPL